MPQDAPARIGPYRLLEPLGKGGMGVVYRAVHGISGRSVALKTVRLTDPRQLIGIRREIHALSRIRHPGIVRIVEHGVADGVPWYAMDLLLGVSLRDHVDAAGTSGRPFLRDTAAATTAAIPDAEDAGPLPPDLPRLPAAGGALHEALTQVRRLCAPLAFLHGEGVVHRDLKPDNVLVVDDHPVLVDFGLVGRLPRRSREALRLDGLPHGTVSYMAPEQIRGEVVDARADLYALGVVLYELLTGQVPFAGTTPGATLTMHLSRTPTAPSRRVSGVPRELDELVLALLEKRPSDRIGHADEVARTLDALGARPPEIEAPPPRAYLYRPRLVGRGPELERLEAHLVGDAPLALLAGESGVGRTRLVMELGQAAAARGWTALVGRCSPSDGASSRVLHPLSDALVAVADQCRDRGEARTDALLGDRGPVLAAFAPDLRTLPGQADRPDPTPLPPEAARTRALTALTGTLEALADGTSVLVLLDDLQWSDALTLQWLDHLRRSSTPLRVIGTYRLGEGPPRLRALCAAEGVTHLTLGRLDAEAVRHMVRDMLGVSPPDALAAHLVDRSEGNPFFVAEYSRAAVAEGLLRRDRRGRWGVVGPDVEALGPTGTLRRLVERRLAVLSPEAAELLAHIAVAGRQVDLAVLEAALPGPADRWLAPYQELIGLRLLEDDDVRLRIAHADVRTVAYAAIPEARRRALHEAVAEALSAGGAPLVQGELGLHWERAGYLERARACYRAAATHAVTAHDLPGARRAFEAYLRLVERVDVDAVEARVALARDVLRPLGAAADALTHLATALSQARHLGDLGLQAAALEEQARVTRQVGRLPDAAALFRHALAVRRGLGQLPDQGRVLCALAGTLPPGPAERAFAAAVGLASAAGDRWLAARARLGLGRIRLDRGQADAAQGVLQEALDGFLALGDLYGRAGAQLAMGDVSVLAPDGAHERALAHYDAAMDGYRTLGDALRIAAVQVRIGVLLHRIGRSTESHAALAEALQTFKELGHHRFQGHALHVLGTHLRREGRLPEARALQEQALVLLGVVGDRTQAARARLELAEIALRQGLPSEAAQLAARASELAVGVGAHALEADAFATQARAAARLGDRPEAQRLARLALSRAEVAGDPRVEASAVAHLARLTDGAPSDDVLRHAESVLRAWGRHEEAARALVELGRLAHERGSSAAPWLEAAREAHHSAVYLDPDVADALQRLADAEGARPPG